MLCVGVACAACDYAKCGILYCLEVVDACLRGDGGPYRGRIFENRPDDGFVRREQSLFLLPPTCGCECFDDVEWVACLRADVIDVWGVCEFCVKCESENFGCVSVWERSVLDCE